MEKEINGMDGKEDNEGEGADPAAESHGPKAARQPRNSDDEE